MFFLLFYLLTSTSVDSRIFLALSRYPCSTAANSAETKIIYLSQKDFICIYTLVGKKEKTLCKGTIESEMVLYNDEVTNGFKTYYFTISICK